MKPVGTVAIHEDHDGVIVYTKIGIDAWDANYIEFANGRFGKTILSEAVALRGEEWHDRPPSRILYEPKTPA